MNAGVYAPYEIGRAPPESARHETRSTGGSTLLFSPLVVLDLAISRWGTPVSDLVPLQTKEAPVAHEQTQSQQSSLSRTSCLQLKAMQSLRLVGVFQMVEKILNLLSQL